MKTLKNNKLILLFVGLLIFNSCVQDDDFTIPNTSAVEPVFEDDDLIFTMSSIAGEVSQAQGSAILDYEDDETIFTYSGEDDAPNIFVSGYVVSSDEGGNYFEELIIQDLAENPTVGIRLRLDVNPLFVRYEVGRKVFINLKGLSAGISNGVLTVGEIDGDRIGQIPASDELKVITRSTEVATIVPLPLALEDFTEDKTNLMIEISDVQFKKSEALGVVDVNGGRPLTYSAEPGESFDAERTLESCTSSQTRLFATSTFADFKGLFLPPGRGSMVAVLQRTFFGDDYYISVNSPEDINFDSDDRCDPIDISNFTVVFEEDFSNGLNGWDVINTVGTRSWTTGDFNNEFYVRGSAFSSGSIVNMVSWLISPSIDFDAQPDEQMVLEIADAFSNGQPLTAFYSNDYVAGSDPSTATWIEIGADEIAALPTNTGFFNNEYDATNLIDLSAVTGNAVLAFVYDSNNATISSTIDLSDVKIVTP
ncbi:MAG: DUF5689 domain-containing protein [Winogradskyella sp.]|uniref:DUF5689 domain-containing protein n=1 Tax=Winogradskyella sp. TaxID=1883156 RepID=UPI003858EDDF